MFIVFGVRSAIKKKNLESRCPNCKRTRKFNFKRRIEYFYLFWIPLFITKKYVSATCISCESIFRNKEINDKLGLKEGKTPFTYHILLSVILVVFVFGGFFIRQFISIDTYFTEKRNEEWNIKKEGVAVHLKEIYEKERVIQQFKPEFLKDSLANKIYSKINFKQFNINKDSISIRSKINGDKVFLMLKIYDWRNNNKELSYVDYLEFFKVVSKVKQYLLINYYPVIKTVYLEVFNEDKRIVYDVPNNYFGVNNFETDFEGKQYKVYPSLGFFDSENILRLDNYEFLDESLIKSMKYQRNIDSVTATKERFDSLAIKKKAKAILRKFNFKYTEFRPLENEELTQAVHYKLNRTVIPDDLIYFSKIKNISGPFLNIGYQKQDFYGRNTESSTWGFYLEDYEIKVADNYDKQLLPLKRCKNWIVFYDDYRYKYAIDTAPGEKGLYGQVILIEDDSLPHVVAKNLEEFLNLYLNKKIPIDNQDWIDTEY